MSYLKQAEECRYCGLGTGAIRADDGPSWLTLLLVGHFLAPFMILSFRRPVLPVWAMTALLIGVAVGLCLAILPRAKGVFIAAIWYLNRPGAA